MVDLWLCSGWVGSGCDSCGKAVKLEVGKTMSKPIGQAESAPSGKAIHGWVVGCGAERGRHRHGVGGITVLGEALPGRLCGITDTPSAQWFGLRTMAQRRAQTCP